MAMQNACLVAKNGSKPMPAESKLVLPGLLDLAGLVVKLLTQDGWQRAGHETWVHHA